MNRASHSTAMLALAIVAGALSLNACAEDKPGSPLEKWSSGTNYMLLEEPQPTRVEKGKVEVVEFFWYGCGHCYALDPSLEVWKASKAPYVEFVRIPVVWGPQHRQHAKLYYTMLELKKPELHSKIFDAIHKLGKPLAAASDAEARAQHLAFFKDQGVTEADFNRAYDSMPVAASVTRADDLSQRYAVASVPLIFVNGRYQTAVGMAGSTEELLSLINDLAASEKGR